MSKIAVDAMGSDDAPGPELEGSLLAVRERGVEVILVGDEPRLRAMLGSRSGKLPPGLTIRHATQVIAMDDPPSAAVKRKKDSSMRVCFDLVKRGEAQGLISAGNSGAMMACGLFVLKRLVGVERPGIVTLAPTINGSLCAVLDVGANTEVKPTVLAQYAAIGSAYVGLFLEKKRPRVAVLSNGEEDSKGTVVTRGAFGLLSQAARDGVKTDFEFKGYAEGRDIFTGEFDVIVTDGYTGNIALKTCEGTTKLILSFLKEAVASSARAKLGALLLKPVFEGLKRRLDPDEFGGAPLLGVDGVVMIGHGNSNEKAMKNGILTADRYVGLGVAPALKDSIARHRAVWDSGSAMGGVEGPPIKAVAE